MFLCLDNRVSRPLRIMWGAAIWEVCVANDLGGLAARDVVVRAEVRQVAGGYARLSRSAAGVAVDYGSTAQPLHEVVEGGVWRNVLVCWFGWLFIEAGRVGDDLSDLAARGRVSGTEVRQVIWW